MHLLCNATKGGSVFLMFVKWSISWIKKIYKVIETSIGFLRQKGMLSAYTDNIVLIHEFFDAYVSTTVATIKLLDKLGFCYPPCYVCTCSYTVYHQAWLFIDELS